MCSKWATPHLRRFYLDTETETPDRRISKRFDFYVGKVFARELEAQLDAVGSA